MYSEYINSILPIFEKFHGGFFPKTLQIGEIPDPLRHLIQCLKFYILLQTIGLKSGVDGRGGELGGGGLILTIS